MNRTLTHKEIVWFYYITIVCIIVNSLIRLGYIFMSAYFVTVVIDYKRYGDLSLLWQGFQLTAKAVAEKSNLTLTATYYLFGFTFLSAIFDDNSNHWTIIKKELGQISLFWAANYNTY